MLTSPQTVTVDGVAHSLSKINQDNYSSLFFKKGTGFEIRMSVRHSLEKATANGQYERHNVDIQYITYTPEGLPKVDQAYTVFRTLRGNDGVALSNLLQGLMTWTGTNKTALVAWEN